MVVVGREAQTVLDGFVPWPEVEAERYRERGYWCGLTLGDLLRGAAREHGSSTALVDGDRRWTYAELDVWADRVAAGLGALGVGAGDRVVVHLPNVAEFVPLCFGMFRRGIVPVLALAAHQESEIAHLLRLSGAVAYVTTERHLGRDYRDTARSLVRQGVAPRHVLVVGDPAEFTGFDAVGSTEPVAEPDAGAAAPAPGDVALLLISGGSTGLPKLIPRTHDDYVYNATASAELCGMDTDTRYLVALPIGHNFPLACPGLLGTFAVGGTAVLCPTPSPDEAFALIAREQVTLTALVPALAQLWMEAVEWEGTGQLASLELLQVGGARLKTASAERVRPTLGCALQQVFGMAEGLLNYTRLDDPDELVHATQGRPMSPDDEVRVVGEDDRDVEPGTVGELLTRGPYTIRGYYGDPVARSFTDDGFYRTGDLVRQLPQGHLVVEGRVKEVINRGGEKIAVEEVEDHILTHSAVRDVALVALPDDQLGERSCAFVVGRGEPPTRPELNAHLSSRGLAAFKFPDRLVVVDSLPRTAVGKADKRALRELAEART